MVRPRHLPPASSSPFAGRRGPLPDAITHGGAGASAVPRAPTPAAPALWHAQGPPRKPCVALPPSVGCSPSWAELQSSASTGQQAASLLPPEAYEVQAVAAEAAPPAAAWPLPFMAPQPAGSTAALAVEAMQWTAYQSAAARHADARLVAAGLAAAGRLGLLPSAAYQQAPLMRLSTHGAQAALFQAPRPAAGPGMADLPGEEQLLSLMGNSPHE